MTLTSQPQRPYSSEKNERLEARLSSAQKALIQHAADLQGRTLTDLVIEATQAAARKIIQEHEVITLTAKGTQVFVTTLLSPGKPNTALKKAAKRHQKFTDKNP